MAAMWRQVSNAVEARQALDDILPGLISTYGDLAATAAADWYDEARAAAGAGGSFSAIPASITDTGAAELAGWATAKGTNLEAIRTLAEGGAQRRILNFSRQTVMGSALADPRAKGWQRVGVGSCDFCSMLIGRGSVYREETADFLSHDHCHCSAAPAFIGAPQPAEQSIDAAPEPAAEARPEPEPEYVDKIAEMLRKGDLTENQARAMLLDPEVKPLSKANLEEALNVVQREQAALTSATEKVAEQAAPATLPTPEGSVAAAVDFPQETLDALMPSRSGWTTGTRAKTLAELKKTPEGRNLLKTMDSFQSGGSTAIPRLRTDIEKYLAGDVADLAQGRIDSIETFLSAVGRSDAGDRALYRGMSIPGELEDVLARYKPGDDLDLSLASFSSDKKLAQDFTLKGAGQKVRGATKTPVFIEWVGEGKRALPIEKLSKSRVFANEKEWVGSGRYVIEGSKKVKRNGVDTVVLTIRQKGVW